MQFERKWKRTMLLNTCNPLEMWAVPLRSAGLCPWTGAGGLGLLSSALFFAPALSAKVASGWKGTLCNSVWAMSVLYLFKMRLPLQFNLLFSPSPSSWWSLIAVLFQVHLVANDAGHHRWIHSNICCVFLGWTLNNNILWICFCSFLLPPFHS